MPSPRRVTRWLLTRPVALSDDRRAHLDELVAACPEMTALARAVREFAQLMSERRGAELDCWIKQVREAGLIELEPFLTGLEQDHDAAVAGPTMPCSAGPIEGVNTKAKLIKRQTSGRAGFPLLRHRILLDRAAAATIESGTEPISGQTPGCAPMYALQSSQRLPKLAEGACMASGGS